MRQDPDVQGIGQEMDRTITERGQHTARMLRTQRRVIPVVRTDTIPTIGGKKPDLFDAISERSGVEDPGRIRIRRMDRVGGVSSSANTPHIEPVDGRRADIDLRGLVLVDPGTTLAHGQGVAGTIDYRGKLVLRVETQDPFRPGGPKFVGCC